MRRIGLCVFLGFSSLAYGGEPAPAALIQGNTRFALDMYKQLAGEPGNIFFSPYSLSEALGMTSAGAKGETLQQINNVLHFPDGGPHAGFSQLDKAIFRKGKPYTIQIANRLWLQKGSPYYPSFKHTLKKFYGSKAGDLDFQRQLEPSRKTINAWVSDRTNAKIPELLTPGILTKETDAVLTNAIYFKGSWATDFKKTNTKKNPFFSPRGEVQADMMFQNNKYFYGEDDLVQTIELPYRGDDLSMVIILPQDKNKFAQMEERFLMDGGEAWLKGHSRREVLLFIPKFKVRWSGELSEVFKNLGMEDAFDEKRADFTAMRPRDPNKLPLQMGPIVHEAFVDVNEKGTEAAAATTALMIRTTSAGPPTVMFRADHPFLYFIRHRPTGTILFMGRFTNP